MKKRISIFLVPFLLVEYCSFAQKANDIAIAFYNCENFFDTIHNPLKQDEEFTPGGKYKYTRKIYEQKLHNIATVLQSMNGGKGAAVIGLAEVENTTVLNDLVHQPEIARHNYKYLLFDGPDKRGINVAMLYDPKHFTELKSEPVKVDLSYYDKQKTTRDILHVFGALDGENVHIFVNHWPSNLSDSAIGVPARFVAATTMLKVIDPLMKQNDGTKVIVMGDLNDNPLSSLVLRVMGANSPRSRVRPSAFYNPWMSFFEKGQGTEIYQHKWNLFDMILPSGAFLINRDHGLHYDTVEIYKPDFITDHHKGHEGEPKRSFLGTHWMNGYSDHFPVILYLSKN